MDDKTLSAAHWSAADVLQRLRGLCNDDVAPTLICSVSDLRHRNINWHCDVLWHVLIDSLRLLRISLN